MKADRIDFHQAPVCRAFVVLCYLRGTSTFAMEEVLSTAIVIVRSSSFAIEEVRTVYKPDPVYKTASPFFLTISSTQTPAPV